MTTELMQTKEMVMTTREEETVREALEKCGLQEADITFFCLMLQRMEVFHPSALKEEHLQQHIQTIQTMYHAHFGAFDDLDD